MSQPRREPPLTCAVLEFTRRHGETLPTLVRCLNDLGIVVHLFASRKVLRDNPFAYVTDVEFVRPGLLTLIGAKLRGFGGYDFVIFNSLERPKVMQRARATKVPLLAVMHNGSLLLEPEYASFFSGSQRTPLVLAKHIAHALLGRDSCSWIAPVLTGEAAMVARDLEPNPPVTRLCVQGYLAFARRNYRSLLQAVEQLAADGVRNFKIVMIGRDRPDGAAFRAQVADRNLAPWFEFSAPELSYRQFYGLMASTRFILPLIDRSSDAYQPYYQSKVTSSLSVSLGTGIVPVMERELARLFDMENHAIVYESGGLAEGMRAALTTAPREYDKMRAGLTATRQRLLRESAGNLRQLLHRMRLL